MTAAHPSVLLRDEAEAVLDAWDGGETFDARAILDARPDLNADKRTVIDLAYVEYCRRSNAGEQIDRDAFLDRFPTIRASLESLIGLHSFVRRHPELLDPPAIAWPRLGERFGDWRLLRELGRGTKARVFLATEASTGDRAVVLKLAPEDGAEARRLGRLGHPRIVPVLSARLEPAAGLSVVVMPYLGAATVLDLLDRAFPTRESRSPRASVAPETLRLAVRPGDPPLDAVLGRPPRDASHTEASVRLAAEVAEALAFLHSQGLVHRDLKPSNVLIAADGRARLLDFNLTADEGATAARIGGTVAYMAPEHLQQTLQGSHSPDPPADLFALGAILYQLLTGRLPFGSTNQPLRLEELVTDQLRRTRGRLAPLRQLNPSVDVGLARIVESCLAADPASRPARAEMLSDALYGWLRRVERRRRVRRIGPWWTAAIAALLLAVGGWFWQWSAPGVPAYQRGRAYYEAGDFEQAAGCFSDATAADGRQPHYWSACAEASLRLADSPTASREARHEFLSRALSCCQRANDLYRGENPLATARLGYCQARSDVASYREAIRHFTLAIERRDDNAATRNDRAFCLIQQHRLAEAEADLDRAAALDPHSTAVWSNRAAVIVQRLMESPAVCPTDRQLSELEDALKLADDRSKAELDVSAAQIHALFALRNRNATQFHERRSFDLLLDAAARGNTQVVGATALPGLADVLTPGDVEQIRSASRGEAAFAGNPRLIDPAPGLSD
jgi:serine/threonine protein kinase/Tfp pilus assembly protein PilF